MCATRRALGCWTRRLRHKKCDEYKPKCQARDQRDLLCHGYGPRPEWFDGGDAERTESQSIKSAMKLSLKRKRQAHHGLRFPVLATDSLSGPARARTVLPSAHTASRSPTPMLLSSPAGNRIASYREAELLMHYIDQVFPLQFRFYAGE
jgi:hypothetical protein